MTRKRLVFVRPDADSFPVRGDIGDAAIAALPAVLVAELRAWRDEFWAERPLPEALDEEVPQPSERFAEWDSVGRSLRERVRKALGEGFIVGYFNQDTDEIEWPNETTF